jgi:predicted secreted protein
MLWRKVAVTTAISIVLFAAVYGIVEYELIALSDIMIEL